MRLIIDHKKLKNKIFRSGIMLLISSQIFACKTSNDLLVLPENNRVSLIEVALLLPLESQNVATNNLAENLMNSARLAVGDLKDVDITLNVYPTSGIPERAAIVAKKAVSNGNKIIIGPLFSAETVAVKKALKDKKIKIISLSNDPSVAGDGVFIMGTTFRTVANRLVKYSVKKNMPLIAIIGPEGTFADTGINSAIEAINSNGGKISTIARYPLTIEGIQKKIPTIYKNIIKYNTDAIIFTDSPTRGLGFVTEQLNQIFEKNEKQPPKFMGLTKWNGARQMLNEPSINKGWFIVPDQRLKTAYVDRYSKTFGVIPNDLSALSYDAIALIGGLFKKLQANKSLGVFDEKNITSRNGFIGINGAFRFNSTGLNERLLAVAEVASGKIKIIDSALSTFDQSDDAK
jgi:ABC-type branched-subunit amino acid transport system substrate-binding protein